MKLITVVRNEQSEAAIEVGEGFTTLGDLNERFGTDWPTSVNAMLDGGEIPALSGWVKDQGELLGEPGMALGGLSVGSLYNPKGKLWGIGLNYREHAGDLDESVPEGLPGSFIKPTSTVIGPGEAIRIPKMSERTTAEAELAIVIGQECRNVPRNWLDVVAGFVTVIDMTAEDILRRNPRFLTLSKSFDTFFVLGPELLTPDEIDDVLQLSVTTVHNGSDHATNLVANMTYPPDYLVALHSEVMTLQPGDIISTGTPGAVPIAHGDTVTCRIDGFLPLTNPVIDEKMDE